MMSNHKMSSLYKPMMILQKVLWVAALLCLIFAWVAIGIKNLVFYLEPLAWFWNALILGVLSLGSKDCAGCGGCESCSSEEQAE